MTAGYTPERAYLAVWERTLTQSDLRGKGGGTVTQYVLRPFLLHAVACDPNGEPTSTWTLCRQIEYDPAELERGPKWWHAATNAEPRCEQCLELAPLAGL